MTEVIISNLARRFQSPFPRMFKIHIPWFKFRFFIFGGIIGIFVLASFFSIATYLHFRQRILPNVTVGTIPVGGLTKTEASEKLAGAVGAYRRLWPATFSAEGVRINVELPENAVRYDLETSIQSAFKVGRTTDRAGLTELITLPTQPVRVPIAVDIDAVWLDTEIATVAAHIDVPSVPPTFDIQKVNDTFQVKVVPGKNGHYLDRELWRNQLSESFAKLTNPPPALPVVADITAITPDQEQAAVKRANYVINATLSLSLSLDRLPEQTWQLTGHDLIAFVRFDTEFDDEMIAGYVGGLSEAVNRPPKDAKFRFDETSNKVQEFVPAEEGVTVAVHETAQAIRLALQKISNGETADAVPIVVERQPPAVSLAEVNRLGITERIGIGMSTYKHSIPTRVHNVELAAARINGTLVKPGEEFSFNAAVGEVSGRTGYQRAYVIREGRTQLDDGGGVCQDSTTVFRAALNAGLPITTRKGHAYRVGYYEQDSKPGYDATVFSPSTDLKFLNDTPGHILIQTAVDSPNRSLTVYIYGTNDGRVSVLSDYALWDVIPPPPDVYTDDPTLPLGTVKQVDYKAVGSKAKFTYTVTRDGETIFQKTFLTVYQPWAAVFLRGTKQ